MRYLQYFATNEERFNRGGWTQNPLAVWHATHPEGTGLTQGQLLWRIQKAFTAMKSQGWVTETHLEHQYHDDEVNTRRFEETLYRITERGKRALIESGNSPVLTRKAGSVTNTVSTQMRTALAGAQRPEDLDHFQETVFFSDGPADQRTVTLPVGIHQEVLFCAGGKDTRYRRTKRPEVNGMPVYVPVSP